MPGGTYLKDPETVKSWKFGLTTVEWRKNDLKKRLAKSEKLVSGEEGASLEPSGEEGVLLMKALLGLGRMVSNVNFPNRSAQISNLPINEVVETNVILEKDNVRPIIAGAMPDELLRLTMPHVRNHALILKAAATCDFNYALDAFMHDPLVSGRITDAQGEALLRDMIRNTAKYLPKPWGNV
jgi:alpha-galactosidase